jgi:hypothetical protein
MSSTIADIVTTSARFTEPGVLLLIELTAGAIGSGLFVAQPVASASASTQRKQLDRRIVVALPSPVEKTVSPTLSRATPARLSRSPTVTSIRRACRRADIQVSGPEANAFGGNTD